MKRLYTVFISCICFLFICAAASAQNWKDLAAPKKGTKWIQPSQGSPAQPVWGHVNGLQVGLSPLPGPRGLLRIYTPYLGHQEAEVMNFIAFEPIVKRGDHRGLSELEMSTLDNKRGKRFWSANDSTSTIPAREDIPATGIIEKTAGAETLTVYVFSEAFDNGAIVYTRLRFYEDQPYEVEITTYTAPGSKDLDHFIVTATMGNYARLRDLYLQTGTVSSGKLWPDYKEDGFTAHAHFPISSFIRDRNGAAYFIAAPNEKNPSVGAYASGTNDHWKYYGKKATQYWYSKNNNEKMEGLVNGRSAYWASQSPIPGGIAYENFELKAPFVQGCSYVFGVSPLTANDFVKKIKNKRK
jgi:hypothetical protein